MTPHFPEALIDRIRQANEIVSDLDASIRAEAFRQLMQATHRTPVLPNGSGGVEPRYGDASEFFAVHQGGSPAENAILIAAFLYSLYGTEAFSTDEVRTIAKDVGLIIPDRVDMTFVSAKREGRSLFQRIGKGRFRPTVNGELQFQRTYDVKKGTRQRTVEASETQ